MYDSINLKLTKLNICHSDYPLDLVLLIEKYYPKIILEKNNFKSNSIRGLIYKGNNISSICLNSARSRKCQNFDCMLFLFYCWFYEFESKILFTEFNDEQAIHGAAEILMPRKLFIKKFHEFNGNIFELSDFFLVDVQAVKYKIDNLEII